MNKSVTLEKAKADRQALWVSLAAVLHDLRNPLHNATLLVESLDAHDEKTAVLRTKILEQLERIHSRIRRVMAQLSDFAGESVLREVPLTHVIDEVLTFVDSQAGEVSVEIVVDCAKDIRIQADPAFLAQAVEHLVLNCLEILAIQPEDKPRKLWLSASREQSSIWLCLKDSGPGLPEAVAKAPFAPVVGANARGMGLGLAIAHALAQAGGGELMLHCTNETGTDFRIRLEGAL